MTSLVVEYNTIRHKHTPSGPMGNPIKESTCIVNKITLPTPMGLPYRVQKLF